MRISLGSIHIFFNEVKISNFMLLSFLEISSNQKMYV